MKCYLVHAYFSGGLDRQIAFNFNIIHVFIERYVFLKKTWGFSNEDWKFVAKARNEKSSGVSYASTWLTDWPSVHGSLVSEVLIEARVDLAAGRLTSAEWLQPTATRGGLRNAARWLEAALVPGCISGKRMVRISFASWSPAECCFLPFLLIVPAYCCWRISRLRPSTDCVTTDFDSPKALLDSWRARVSCQWSSHRGTCGFGGRKINVRWMTTAYGHARWLKKCCSLIGSGTRAWLYIWEAHGQDFIRFLISSRVLFSAVSPDSSSLLLLTYFST